MRGYHVHVGCGTFVVGVNTVLIDTCSSDSGSQ